MLAPVTTTIPPRVQPSAEGALPPEGDAFGDLVADLLEMAKDDTGMDAVIFPGDGARASIAAFAAAIAAVSEPDTPPPVASEPVSQIRMARMTAVLAGPPENGTPPAVPDTLDPIPLIDRIKGVLPDMPQHDLLPPALPQPDLPEAGDPAGRIRDLLMPDAMTDRPSAPSGASLQPDLTELRDLLPQEPHRAERLPAPALPLTPTASRPDPVSVHQPVPPQDATSVLADFPIKAKHLLPIDAHRPSDGTLAKQAAPQQLPDQPLIAALPAERPPVKARIEGAWPPLQDTAQRTGPQQEDNASSGPSIQMMPAPLAPDSLQGQLFPPQVDEGAASSPMEQGLAGLPAAHLPAAGQSTSLSPIPSFAATPPHLVPDLVRLIAAQPDGPVSLTLRPEELGTLKFHLTQTGDEMRIHLTVDQPATLDLLRRHADQLVAELRQAGFGNASLAFSGGGAQDGPPRDDPPSRAVAQAEQVATAFAPPPQRAATGALDLRL